MYRLKLTKFQKFAGEERQNDTTVSLEIMASFGEAPATTEAAPEVAPATESAPAPAATAGGDEGDEGT